MKPMNGRPSLFDSEIPIRSHFNPEAEIVVHTGDTHTFLTTLPDRCVQLVVTSPPYNIGKSYEVRVEIDTYLRVQERVVDELIRVLKVGGSVCWQVGNYVEDAEIYPLDVFFYPLFKSRGLRLRNRIVWHFEHGLHATKRYSGRYETLLWFTKGDEYTFNLDAVRVPAKYPGKTHFKGPKQGKPSGNPLGKNPSDVWRLMADEWEGGMWNIPNVKANHPEKTIHPCQFPVELAERCVLAATNPGDWVLDPYCGVGSSLLAGVKHERRVLGCDKEADYTAVAEQRIREFQAGTLRLRPLGKPVHQPTGREKVARRPEEWEGAE